MERDAAQTVESMSNPTCRKNGRQKPSMAWRSTRRAFFKAQIADHQILAHRQMGKQVQLLIDDPDAQPLGVEGIGRRNFLALQQDLPAIRPHRARQNARQSAFARPIFAHQGMDFPGGEFEPGRGQRRHAAKTLVDVLGQEKRCHARTLV